MCTYCKVFIDNIWPYSNSIILVELYYLYRKARLLCNGDRGTTQYYSFITTFIAGLLRGIPRQEVSSKPFLRRD